ncbi:DUF4345 domain-containing protein [Thiomicrorhabdus indica]|uniref:DUF4345 domain-containing protein n=1 Tax=Thiomicrorhabdus indica TaxID=2267253 RepID=UPI002AA6F2A2|nr:DUF4345 domain-containing protein [Thiomicrorhabdus indica]
MDNLMTKIYLLIAGMIIILVGGFISLTPNEYLASMNVQNSSLDRNLSSYVSLLSDLIAMGGLMIVIGLSVFMATFRNDLMKSAVLISTTFYATFVVFRVLGFLLDGIPQFEIMLAFLIEVILAFCGLFLILLKRHQHQYKAPRLVNPAVNN